MKTFLELLNFVLFIYMILVLIKPQKFMPFVNTTNGRKRLISVALWLIVGIIMTNVPGDSSTGSSSSDQSGDKKDTTVSVLSNELKSARGDSADLAKGNVFNVGKDATVDDIIMKAALYMTYTSETDTIKDPTLKALRQHNSKVAKKLWEAKSPQLRKQYVSIIKDKLWENDIDVKTTNGGKDIWFIGAIFAAHKNIKDFEAQTEENLKALGFHRAYYRWVDSDLAEYTYYDLN